MSRTFPTLIALFASFAFNACANAQQASAKGIVIFKERPSMGDRFAAVVEFEKIEFFQAVVNLQSASGANHRITFGQLVSKFDYPDLKNGTIKTPEEIEKFKILGKNLTAASEKFPNAKAILTPRIEEMKIAAVKFNEGLILEKGRWSTPAPETPNTPLPPPNTVSHDKDYIPVLINVRGEKFEGVRVLRKSNVNFSFSHKSGVRTSSWNDFDEGTQIALGFDRSALEKEEAEQSKKIQKAKETYANLYGDLVKLLWKDNLREITIKNWVDPTECYLWRASASINAKNINELNEFTAQAKNATTLSPLVESFPIPENLCEVRRDSIIIGESEHPIEFHATVTANDGAETSCFAFGGTFILKPKSASVVIFIDTFKLIDALGGKDTFEQNMFLGVFLLLR